MPPLRFVALAVLLFWLLPLATAAPGNWSWIEKEIPGHGQEPIRTNKSIRLGGYVYTFPGWSLEEKKHWVGNNLDVWSYDRFYNTPETLDEIRAINPAICLLDTFCPIICDAAEKGWLNVGGYDADRMSEWVLRTSGGSEAPNPLWSWEDTHLMDIGNIYWATYFRNRALEWVREWGGDGYFLDGVPWDGVYYLGYGHELRDYATPAEVNEAIGRFLERAQSEEILILDDQPSEERQEHLDGVWDEAWLVYDQSVPWPWAGTSIGMDWEASVGYLEAHTRNLRPYVAQGWYHYGDRTALEFLAASYLLGKQSNSATFMPMPMGSPALPEGSSYDLSSYSGEVYRNEINENLDILDVELGPAIGNSFKMGYIWGRRFADGWVYVNPSDIEVCLPLSTPLTDLDGEVASRVCLSPGTASILVSEGELFTLLGLALAAARYKRQSRTSEGPWRGTPRC